MPRNTLECIQARDHGRPQSDRQPYCLYLTHGSSFSMNIGFRRPIEGSVFGRCHSIDIFYQISYDTYQRKNQIPVTPDKRHEFDDGDPVSEKKWETSCG